MPISRKEPVRKELSEKQLKLTTLSDPLRDVLFLPVTSSGGSVSPDVNFVTEKTLA